MEKIDIDCLEKQVNETIIKRKAIKEVLKTLEDNLASLEKTYLKKQSNFFSRMFDKKDTIEKIAVEIDETQKQITATKNELDTLIVEVDKLHNEINETEYNNLLEQFLLVSKSNKIWKIVSQEQNTATKSSVGTHVEKQEVSFSTLSLEFISSKFKAFYLKNINGAGLFIYPSFVLQFNTADEVHLTSLESWSFLFSQQRFIESKNSIPSDSKIIDYVWNRVNKDGSRDLRFAGNFQQPVVQYGSYSFTNPNGINLKYYISNYEASENFANNFKRIYLTPKKNSNSYIPNKPTDPNNLKTENPLFKNFDPLFVHAARLMVTNQIGSTSLIMRKMKLGYNSASKLMDDLEKAGIMRKNTGNEARKVLVKDSDSLNKLLKSLEAV